MDPVIEKLLILQHRDGELSAVKRDLERVPAERAALEKRIAEERAAVETARTELRDMELRRNELDGEVEEKRTQVDRYRNQQLEVKKNEEYRALTHEIEQTEAAINTLEEQEIGLMLEIDGARERFETAKGEIEERIGELEGRVRTLDARKDTLATSLSDAESAYAQAREGLPEAFLEAYDRVARMVRGPVKVARIEDHKCSGCHLRVSNETVAASKVAGEVHFCDQCGRIVYQ